MSRPKSLNTALKAANLEIQQYIVALESENLKLHKQMAKLQVKDVTQQNEITALRREVKELTNKHGYSLHINLGGETPATPLPSNASSQGAAR